MPLSQEQFEALPDFAKSDYVQHEGAYVPQAELKVGGLKNSLDGLDAKLREIERKRQEDIDAATAKARADALEEAKKSNNIDEILKIEREQAEDAKKRAIEEAKLSWQREMSEKEAAQRSANLAREIALTVAVDEAAAELIELAIRSRIKSDVDLKKDIFSDRSGGALSVDKSGFAELISKEPQFSRLVKANIATTGAGGSNGNNGGGASRKPEDYTEQERVQLFKTNPTLFHQLFPKRS